MCLTTIDWEKIFLVFALLSIFEDLSYLGGEKFFSFSFFFCLKKEEFGTF